MWRNIARKLLVQAGLIVRPAFEVRYVERHPAPAETGDGHIVIVRGEHHLKWACFHCPGGCGNRLQLPLNPTRRPRWTVRADWLNRPTIEPSVLQRGACGAHFWIIDGSVRWCPDTACGRN
jgi:hypothetical protein